MTGDARLRWCRAESGIAGDPGPERLALLRPYVLGAYGYLLKASGLLRGYWAATGALPG